MLAGALTALALAAALVAVALDARAWSETLVDEDARFQVAPTQTRWQRDEWTPFGLSRRGLGIDDDLRLRRAYRLFQLARRPAAGGLAFEVSGAQAAFRVRATIALSDVARRERDRERRSHVANFLGLLTFDEALNDQRNVDALVGRSMAYLRRAIALDATNEDAKYNLEFILQLTEPAAREQRDRVGLYGLGEGIGAGATPSGRGY